MVLWYCGLWLFVTSVRSFRWGFIINFTLKNIILTKMKALAWTWWYIGILDKNKKVKIGLTYLRFYSFIQILNKKKSFKIKNQKICWNFFCSLDNLNVWNCVKKMLLIKLNSISKIQVNVFHLFIICVSYSLNRSFKPLFSFSMSFCPLKHSA